MPRACTVCLLPERAAIDAALAGGEPNRRIATQYGLSEAAVRRHRADHIPELLLKAYEAIERDNAEDLAGELMRVKSDVHRLKEKAEAEGDLRTALAGCDKALKALELQAKIEQLIQTAPQVNILVSPEWVELRTKLLYALDAHPLARESVLRALEAGDNG